MNYKQSIESLLNSAGIEIGKDIIVNDDRLYRRILAQGSLGLGEAYMDGWWDSDQLDEFFSKLLDAEVDKHIKKNVPLILDTIRSRIFNLQSRKRAFQIGKKHYNIGNKLFQHMLDKRMTYTCGYWKEATNLDEAQEAKLDLICKKLDLKPGMTVLDIGCGWGSFLKYAAEKYGVKAVGITVSSEQVELAKEMCKGLPIEIKLQDYRNIGEKFDRIVSVGMIEHVGVKNYRTFMEVIHRSLKDDGLFLLHTIGKNTSTSGIDPWVAKYIFPNSMLPSIKQLSKSFEKLFVMEDWHNFSAYYDKTLMSWSNNFKNSWDEIKSDYDDRFYRMWEYYLLAFAGSFRSRRHQLWQIVLSKKGVKGGYQSIR